LLKALASDPTMTRRARPERRACVPGQIEADNLNAKRFGITTEQIEIDRRREHCALPPKGADPQRGGRGRTREHTQRPGGESILRQSTGDARIQGNVTRLSTIARDGREVSVVIDVERQCGGGRRRSRVGRRRREGQVDRATLLGVGDEARVAKHANCSSRRWGRRYPIHWAE
jgi:hypothetical protein